MKIKYTNEQLIEAVKKAYSYRNVARILGLSQDSGSTIKKLKESITELELDISHFTGQRWNKGKTFRTNDSISNKYSDEECFCKNCIVAPKFVKERILRLKLIEYKCHKCGMLNEWQGEELVLEIDHIDGDVYNNELTNLRFLCPNCHSQTDTYRSRTKTKDNRIISDEEIIDAVYKSNNIRQTLIRLGLSPKGDNYIRVRDVMIKNNLVFENW